MADTQSQAKESYFDTRAAFQQALFDVIAQTQQSLILFDLDLCHCALESPAGEELLRGLCQRSSTHDAIRILLCSATFFERECPRLQRLYEHFGHRMQLRLVNKMQHNCSDLGPFSVGDNKNLVTRFHQDSLRGKLMFNAAADCRIRSEQFEHLWEQTHQQIQAGRIGL